MKIYVGNLSFSSTESDIREHFSQHGDVLDVKLVTDRETGRPRGFGFVEMSDDDARAAISALDGQELDGRRLTVNEARPREDRGGRGGGGGGGGGGRGRW